MQIFPDRDRYRCFSCNEYGDQIDLVAEALNIPLSQTLQLLARDLGIDINIDAEERERIKLEQRRRQQERQKLIDQQNTIKAVYNRLIDIEKLLYLFISSIKDESDLDRFEVICALKARDLLDDWINTLLYGSPEEQTAVADKARKWNPWRTEESN